MLIYILPHLPTLPEIPTGLSALGMTGEGKAFCKAPDPATQAGCFVVLCFKWKKRED